MKKEILVNVEFDTKAVAILEDGRLEEYFVERPTDKQLVGSIYKGKVSSIVPGIGAAFIDLGLEKNGFLYVSDVVGTSLIDGEEAVYLDNGDKPNPPPPPRREKPDRDPQIQDLLKKDQEIMVQVVKEPFGTKGARLTCELSLAGRFVVFMPLHQHIGISKKIDDRRERERIRDIIRSVPLPKEAGLIVRTAAWGCDPKVLERDIRFLVHQWRLIQRRCSSHQGPCVVHEEYDLVLRMIRDVMSESFDRIVVNERNEHKRIDRFMRAAVPTLRSKLQLYAGDVPLFVSHGIQKEIDKIYESRAVLRSGGHIVIEQTEALVAIDVNTGKYTGSRNLEDTAYRTNCEAAREIAKQIRLRDLGGIIIIDFIDMDSPEHRRSVLKILEESLRKDRAKTSFLNLSQLGLVEMTRQRMRKSLESASSRDCPYCLGRGVVRSGETIAIEAFHKLSHFLKGLKGEHIELVACPEVIEVLSRDNCKTLRLLESAGRNRVSLLADAHIHVEEIRLKRILDKRRKLW